MGRAPGLQAVESRMLTFGSGVRNHEADHARNAAKQRDKQLKLIADTNKLLEKFLTQAATTIELTGI